jgi:rare lipoprotein A (peptidoglycan hydrolase)
MEIKIGSKDHLTPEKDTYLMNGEKIEIVRVEEREEIEFEKISYKVKEEKDNTLLKGKTKVTQEGKNGKRKLIYKTFWENGEMVGKDLVKDEVIEAAEDKIVVIGTKLEVLATESGRASWYDAPSMTAAHKTFPKGSKVRVTNISNGKTIVVTIADRGPYVNGRIIDLSKDAFGQIGNLGSGTASVKIELLNPN